MNDRDHLRIFQQLLHQMTAFQLSEAYLEPLPTLDSHIEG